MHVGYITQIECS